MQVQANFFAFAALLEDGSVVTWGNSAYEGDSSAVQHQIRGVQQIQAFPDGRGFRLSRSISPRVPPQLTLVGLNCLPLTQGRRSNLMRA